MYNTAPASALWLCEYCRSTELDGSVELGFGVHLHLVLCAFVSFRGTMGLRTHRCCCDRGLFLTILLFG